MFIFRYMGLRLYIVGDLSDLLPVSSLYDLCLLPYVYQPGLGQATGDPRQNLHAQDAMTDELTWHTQA